MSGVQANFDPLGQFHFIFSSKKSCLADAVEVNPHEVGRRIFVITAAATLVFGLLRRLFIFAGELISPLERVDVVIVKHGITHVRENLLRFGADTATLLAEQWIFFDLLLKRIAPSNSSIKLVLAVHSILHERSIYAGGCEKPGHRNFGKNHRDLQKHRSTDEES